jgi:hypothetical protein
MAAKTPIDDPEYWRNRAEETRAKAESFSHRDSKDRLLKIAEEYERWQAPDKPTSLARCVKQRVRKDIVRWQAKFFPHLL